VAAVDKGQSNRYGARGVESLAIVVKTSFIGALVLLVALANVRMVCFDHSRLRRAPASCDEICPRTQPAASDAQQHCVLVAGGCSVISAFVVALPVPLVRVTALAATLLGVAAEPGFYRSMVPPPASPPPEL
jgi:hypothetical protein